MLHPTIQRALVPFAPPPQSDDLMPAYIRALIEHDWQHEYSDDHSAWVAGRQQRARLMRMREALDPAWKVWNQHAPQQFRVPA